MINNASATIEDSCGNNGNGDNCFGDEEKTSNSLDFETMIANMDNGSSLEVVASLESPTVLVQKPNCGKKYNNGQLNLGKDQ